MAATGSYLLTDVASGKDDQLIDHLKKRFPKQSRKIPGTSSGKRSDGSANGGDSVDEIEAVCLYWCNHNCEKTCDCDCSCGVCACPKTDLFPTQMHWAGPAYNTFKRTTNFAKGTGAEDHAICYATSKSVGDDATLDEDAGDESDPKGWL